MTNEPTTEIVEEITNQSTTNDIIVVLKMIVQYLESFTMDKMSRDVMSAAADRLESQEEEKKISRYLIEMQSNVITELTARAEKAEWERDAAIGHVHDAIFGTNHSCFYCTMENCHGCTNSTVKEHFKYRALKPNKYLTIQDERGLPQDGEGK